MESPSQTGNEDQHVGSVASSSPAASSRASRRRDHDKQSHIGIMRPMKQSQSERNRPRSKPVPMAAVSHNKLTDI